MVNPHGGKLINRVLSDKRREKIKNDFSKMPQLPINEEVVEDVNNIAYGVFSPIEGFMLQDDVLSIIKSDRLTSNLPWTVPIVLDVSNDIAKKFSVGDEIALTNGNEVIAVLNLEQKYKYDKKSIAQSVFQTLDSNHPGVTKVMESNDTLLGGKIGLVNTIIKDFKEYTFYPQETRALFKEKGWKTVVGFQTRNVPHIGHEYLQKTALSLVDGLFINPIICKKKKDDFLDSIIIDTYNILINNYYKKDRTMLGILRTRMRYAGPKEAIFHSIMRKNFGCTHFIVGRDHAGVGNYYGPYDAQKIFEKFPDLEIEPIKFSSFYICKKCQGVCNDFICPHDGTEYQVNISGNKMRQMIVDKEFQNLTEYVRPEVAKYLISQKELFVK